MKLWEGEDWYLQLDSHHRFARDWDLKLLRLAEASGSDKPVITTYCPPYTPGSSEPLSPIPLLIEFDRFSEDGIAMFRPGYFPKPLRPGRPVRARFASAHLFFAPGRFVEDVPYDPYLYFTGEEIALAVRAFTHGYDFFHPPEVLVWHEFTRAYRRKHWEDHGGSGHRRAWYEHDAASRQKVVRLCTAGRAGRFGCGRARTLADYEAFAGISFQARRVQDYTRRRLEPPNPPADPDWVQRRHDRLVRISFPTWRLTPAALEDPHFWYVGIHDQEGGEVFRADADPGEISRLLAPGSGVVTLERRFESEVEPARWTVLPCSRSAGWQPALDGPLVAAGERRIEFTGRPRGGWFGGETDLSTLFPRATVGLNRAEADGHFVVRRPGGPIAHSLNSSGMLLLELANGRYSLSEIVEVVERAYGLDRQPRKEVLAFFERAWEEGLVAEATEPGEEISA